MKGPTIPLLSLALITVVFLGGRISGNAKRTLDPSGAPKPEAAQGGCTPAFYDGGGPYYKPDAPFRNKISPEGTVGERLLLAGRVMRNDCRTPVANAVLDVWQADETGVYPDDWFRGRVITDEGGNYRIDTVVPKGYGEGTGYRPPHIHFKVVVGNKEFVTSQVFFPEVKGTPGFDDAFIMKLKTDRSGERPVHYGSHDIILP